MSAADYPVEPEVALAIEKLRGELTVHLVRLEGKIDALQSPGKARAATAGAVAAGATVGLFEGLRRLFS